jgi:hypothetical protein
VIIDCQGGKVAPAPAARPAPRLHFTSPGQAVRHIQTPGQASGSSGPRSAGLYHCYNHWVECCLRSRLKAIALKWLGCCARASRVRTGTEEEEESYIH